MKSYRLITFFVVITLALFSTSVFAANNREDSDTRLVDAKVVEVSEARISVIAKSGVEHVIAIDNSGTKVRVEGKMVSPKDVREGDIVTIELDEKSPVKFAKNIMVMDQSSPHVARHRP